MLTEFEQRTGETAVFVASERPTVVSMAKGGRLNYANVNFGVRLLVLVLEWHKRY